MEHRQFLSLALVTGGAAVTLSACGGASGGGGPLIVYSNSVSDGRGEWLQARAAEDDIALEFVDMGGGDIQNRLIAEAANPVADVVFGLNNIYFENLKSNDVLAAYTPSWSEAVDAADGDGEMFWSIVREPIMLVYNTAAFTEAGPPQDWPDLWQDERFQGRYEVPTGMGSATSQVVISGILSRHLDPSGDLGVSAEGWSEIEQYFANGSPAVEATDLYARMANGEIDCGQMWLAGKASREQEYAVDTEPVRPEVGVPMAVQHVGLVNGAKRAEQAQTFIDWFGSAEIQAEWSNEFFTAPTNEDALEDADQDAVELTESFEAQEIDWSAVAENLDDWVEKIELQYIG